MTSGTPSQMNLFDAALPDFERYPHNTAHFSVKKCVFPDLLSSSDPLIITGFTSLSLLLDFFTESQQQQPPLQSIRVMLGHEPTPTTRQDFTLKNVSFTQEFERYWLEKRISLYLSAQVLLAIDLLQRGIIRVRIGNDALPLHAKIYKGDQAVTLGSSNFSVLGLMKQTEANVRFVQPSHEQLSSLSSLEQGKLLAEQQRFEETSRLAEYLWAQGVDYTKGLLELLQRLLQTVTTSYWAASSERYSLLATNNPSLHRKPGRNPP